MKIGNWKLEITNTKKRRMMAVVSVSLLILGGLAYWKTAYGVTRTWDGGGTTENWSECANWAADTCPTASDIATFDGTSTKNATIDASISVAGIDINTGYTGTITQSGSFTVTVGSSHYDQADGTFTGGSGAITVNGAFTLSSGTFTSTTGTLQISAGFTHTAGGTFNHNNGTVTFSSNGTVDVAVSEVFYDLTKSGGGTITVITAGDTLVVTNTFTHSTGFINTGTVEARGSVTLGSDTSTSTAGTGTLSFLVAGDQAITASGGKTINVDINKPSGTVSLAGSARFRSFALSSGTFTSTSGTLTLWLGGWTHTAGGTFNHNNGTVSFIGDSPSIDVATSETFNSLTFNVNGSSASISIGSGDTLIVLGTLYHWVGTLNVGTVEARGNVVVGSGVGASTGGTGKISFLVAGDQTISGSGGETAALYIDKPSGTVTVTGNLTAEGNGVTIVSGTFTGTTGTLKAQGWTHTAGGTFNHNNGTVVFKETGTVNVNVSETFYNLGKEGANQHTTITAGDTVIALGSFTHTSSQINTGMIEVRGNVTIATTAAGGTATLAFTGGNDQTYTDQGGDEPNGDITINKSGGTVTLASNADWNATSQDLTVTSGLLHIPDPSSLSTTALTIGASGHFRMSGTGDLTLAGTVSNAGEMSLRSTACGGTDYILVRSSVNGTQRSFTGAGTFTLHDVDVKDMAGTAPLTVYSGTNSGNNGANWTFSGASCADLPPAVNIGSGMLNIRSGVVNFR